MSPTTRFSPEQEPQVSSVIKEWAVKQKIEIQDYPGQTFAWAKNGKLKVTVIKNPDGSGAVHCPDALVPKLEKAGIIFTEPPISQQQYLYNLSNNK